MKDRLATAQGARRAAGSATGFWARCGPVVACALAILLVMGVFSAAGCARVPKKGDTVFTPREQKDGFAQAQSEAKDVAGQIRGKTPRDPMTTAAKSRVSGSAYIFARGNEKYREADYLAALDEYDAALRTQPYHYGALNNRTLALLQLERNDEALVAALVVLELFPDLPESYLNLQAAAHAAGYGQASIASMEAHGKVFDAPDGGIPGLRDAAEYNRIYAEIEYNIDPEAKKDDKKRAYELIQGDLSALAEKNPEDTDIKELQAYLRGIGMITGAIPYSKR
ncbi:MAG: hypothetical protein FWE94_06155 [Coriobacteriia bacterium]|nr:hypothetical protein [Coriobacteriia bacterium]